jgi:hypothetical protein
MLRRIGSVPQRCGDKMRRVRSHANFGGRLNTIEKKNFLENECFPEEAQGGDL